MSVNRLNFSQSSSVSNLNFNCTSNVSYSLPNTIFSPQLSALSSSGILRRLNCGAESSLSVRQKVVQIWRRFYHSIASCASAFCSYISSFFRTPYPTINNNMSKEALLKIYWGLGEENKWRECMDGRYHHLGKFAFDRGLHQGTVEPGYIASLEKAVRFTQLALNKKIDAQWYLELHKQTAGHFDGNPAIYLMGQEKVGVFRGSNDYVCCKALLGVYAVSKPAKAEFEALDLALKNEFGSPFGLGTMTYNDAAETSVRIDYHSMSQSQVLRVFNKFLNEFYVEVEKAQTPDQKLLAIARLHQRLEWLHPVKDGTSRTSTVLLNKFLTDYGFHPAILEYPHVSSTYTLIQWKEYLQKGLIKWEQERARLNPTAQ